MQKWREQLPRLLVESALIVFSILLALAVDEWRQERKQTARLEEAHAAFVEEIRQNLALVQAEEHLPRRKRMWNRYRELGQLPSPSQADLERLWTEFDGGVWPTPFRDAVWRSLSSSEVMGRMPYAQRFVLADIYREQWAVDRWHDRMFDAWSQLRSDKGHPEFVRDNIGVTSGYLADVVAAEERLVRLYEEALRQLGAPR